MGSEIMREILTDEKSAHLLVTESATDRLDESASLTRGEWFGIHVMTLIIGAWNLFAVNLAHAPGKWWFWIPIAIWVPFLAIHAGWLSWSKKRLVGRTTVVNRGEGVR
jgi:hypothetical protein